MTKKKNQVISVPTSKSLVKTKTTKKTALPTKNTKAKTLVKPRSARSKENTLAYYDCVIEQVANTDKAKITKLCN